MSRCGCIGHAAPGTSGRRLNTRSLRTICSSQYWSKLKCQSPRTTRPRMEERARGRRTTVTATRRCSLCAAVWRRGRARRGRRLVVWSALESWLLESRLGRCSSRVPQRQRRRLDLQQLVLRDVATTRCASRPFLNRIMWDGPAPSARVSGWSSTSSFAIFTLSPCSSRSPPVPGATMRQDRTRRQSRQHRVSDLMTSVSKF